MNDNSPIDMRNGFIPDAFLQPNSSRIYNNAVSIPFCATCQHIISDDVSRGMQVGGWMSPVRRFFCLFVTFDFLLISLIWLMSLVLAGNFDFTSAFYKEILHYTIKTSFFDVVFASICRLVFLLLFYGLLQINHWIIVALTTAGTCCFLVAKVYFFEWSESQQVLSIMLILSSFIIAWSEVWLLDIKVVPQEKSAIQYLTGINSDERTPLMRSYIRSRNPQFDIDSIAGTFYSPVESLAGSEDEIDDRRIERNDLLTWITRGLNERPLVEEAWGILTSDAWTQESVTADGDKICSKKLNKSGKKAFRIIGMMDAPVNLLVEILYHRIEEFPIWNPTVTESRILKKLNSFSDIVYLMSAEAGRGLVSSRDFVLVRHCDQRYGFHILASRSVDDSFYPLKKNVIRGENGAGCWALREVAVAETEVRWLLNSNIRGWLPQYAVDSAMTSAMADNLTYLRKRVRQLRQPSDS